MKKFILIVITLLGLISCHNTKSDKNITIPVEVCYKLQESSPDTLYMINNEGTTYIFDSNKKLLSYYDSDNSAAEVSSYKLATLFVISIVIFTSLAVFIISNEKR
jgi:hypothetical protein